MSKTAAALYLTRDIRLCEHKAVNDLGLTEEELMERAGMAALNTLLSIYPKVRSIAVFCGGGNNGGDGYVVARLAQQKGIAVIVYQYKAIEELPPTARHAATLAVAAGVSCQFFDDALDSDVELIVDGLLGIGLQDDVRDPIAHVISLMNDSGLPVLSLDVPSGLDVNTGRVCGICVQADVTVTYIAQKIGMFTLDGPDYCGEIVCHDLQIGHCLADITPAAYQLNGQQLKQIITPRRKNSHKGMYGHVLIIGGGPGMPGAVYLAACAALRVGAGAVTIATWPEHAKSVLPLLPEAMIYAIHDEEELLPLLARATVCVIGPGLGEDEWARQLFSVAIAAQLPLVIDASALRLLAQSPQQDDNWILTPHPGEAAGLLACSTAEIQADRCKAAQRIQQKYGGNVILKGVGTMVNVGTQEAYLCTAGNPGMASAGMGDVLSGVIGGLLAQGLQLADAARVGVWLHATAGDDAVGKSGERGLLASDLIPYIRHRVNV
ncbi:bifunctional ADP-dependent NAD(P)H-hydrate dehydratase/NAD(P)H-hydrate epimerase [Legionella oakridgensis]|uniref:bifunctional ADP-dependent NAD(P)H-hydrate dehydratase/NAD(P)H-hydrate epimerase n=1 Tax=Legionella oakridgensis TaxID=29423 RepID=UPI0003DE573E|nr:bifunctional ADP-dependent NAD(P)H-hydrate dehydratase/NAD(P)H-hydrate epimerase [Legionella oakridgensis]ETO92296.1 yjeF C-terminal region, hydroxyethylthiazole kinase-related/yjeF N-terminal region [Legionella oakridgensis RV-2-2007]